MKKNRALIALSTIAIHLSIGSVYAYSVYKAPISEQLGWEGSKVALAFTLAIFFLGATAAFCGKWIEQMGPRKAGLAAAVLFCGGLAIAGLGVQMDSLYTFYLGYGVIGGIGLGVGYLAPVSTLVSWFPDRRGLATGMAVMGFGAGAFLAGPLAARLIEWVGIYQTLYVFCAGYFVLMVVGSLYLERPPGSNAGADSHGGGDEKREHAVKADMTSSEALRSPRFWLLWGMMFINITTGIMLISIASPMAQDQIGITAAGAATMVGIMGLFNGGGRIGWSALSDKWGRANLFTMFFVVQLIALPLLPHLTSVFLFQLTVFIIVSFYGGGFALSPAFIGDLFGTKHLGVILGYMLTSWSVGGIVGPMAVAAIYERTGGYELAFYLVAAMMVFAVVFSLLIRRGQGAAALRS
jgi:MFS transporter, OFA family, oxalate/formate antiporter